tara:strand:- start:283 stop:1350 length:1068 start_codon:yes stop_codon:yes gene_type:complete
MAIDFKTLLAVAPLVLKSRKPLMLRGGHGKGKSELIHELAESMGLQVVERRTSQMTEGDTIGLPYTDGNCTSFRPMDWFMECCENPRILFFDEIDRCIPEVAQAIFEITDSRKLNGNYLHEDTLIIAAVNGGEHGSQYQVRDMDPAELDRWTVFDVEPTVEDWLDWSKDKIHNIVWDFINQNRGHLDHSGEFEPNKVYPSRRSWVRLNDCLMLSALLEDAKAATMPIFELTKGFCGGEAATTFVDFACNYEKVITPGDIIIDGKHDLVEQYSINEHLALIEKMDSVEILKPELSADHMQNLAVYFVNLPSEIAMKLWVMVGKGEMQNAINLHKSVVDGQAVSSYIVEMTVGMQNS